MYEKTKIQQSTLSKGEVQYMERIEDIRVLKVKIKELKRDLAVVQSRVTRVDELKKEVYNLERQLLQERTKVKALSEELENPMNIHRWRKLEGSDPTAYEMIQKVQTLQKRLIAKTEEVVDRDIQIQEMEKKIEELNTQLQRMPSTEEVQKLSVYKQNLKLKGKQMKVNIEVAFGLTGSKALTSQLNMYELQVENYKHDIGTLTKDIQDLQKKYFEHKRKEHLKDQSKREEAAPPQSPASPNRFVGGGFKAFGVASGRHTPTSTPATPTQLPAPTVVS